MLYPRLRELREDNDYTQSYLACQLHVNQKTYSRYETGEHQIPLDILCKLAKLYDVSTDYLLNMTDIKKPYQPGKKVV